MFEDRCSQLVSVVTLWGENCCNCTRVLSRYFADDFQTPLPNRRTDCVRMTFMSAKYVRQSFFSNHLQGLSQAVNEVRGGRRRGKTPFHGLQQCFLTPIKPWPFCSVFCQQGPFRNPVQNQAGTKQLRLF